MRLWEDIDQLAQAIKDFELDKIDAKTLSRTVESEMQDPTLPDSLGKLTKAIKLLNNHAPEVLQNSSIPVLLPEVLEALDPSPKERKKTKQILQQLQNAAGLGIDNLEKISGTIKQLNQKRKRKPPIKVKPKDSSKPTNPEKWAAENPKQFKADVKDFENWKKDPNNLRQRAAERSGKDPSFFKTRLSPQKPEEIAPKEKPTEEAPMPADKPVQPIAARLGKPTGYPLAKVMYTLGDMAIVRVMGEVNRNGRRVKKLSFVQVPLEAVQEARKSGNMEGQLWDFVRERYYLSYLNRIRQRLRDSGLGDEVLNNPNQLRAHLQNLSPEDEAYADLRALKTTYSKQFSSNSLDAVRRLHTAVTEDPNPENFTDYLKTYVGSTPEESLIKAIDRISRVKPNQADNLVTKYILMMDSDQKDRFFDTLERVIKSRKPFNRANIQKYLNSVWRRKNRGTPALAESQTIQDLVIETEIDKNLRALFEAPRARSVAPERGATFSAEDLKLAERGLLYSLMVGALRNNPQTILNFAQKFGILEPRDNAPKFKAERDLATEPTPDQVEAEMPAATQEAENLRQDVEKYSKMLQDPNLALQLIDQSKVPEQYQNYIHELASDPAEYISNLTNDPKDPRHLTLRWVKAALAGIGIRATKVDQNRARRAAQQSRIARGKELQSLQKRNLQRRLSALRQPQESVNFDDALNEVLVEYDILPDRIVNLDSCRQSYLEKSDRLEEARINAHRLASSAIDTYIDNNDEQLLNLVTEDATKAFGNYTNLLIESDLPDLIYTPSENEDLLSELVRYSRLTCSPKTNQGWKSLLEYHKNPQKSTRQMKNNLMWIRGPSKIS